jgi:hypothetical protein
MATKKTISNHGTKFMNNNDDDYDKASVSSEVSTYTDMRVFNGAISNLIKRNKINGDKSYFSHSKNNNPNNKKSSNSVSPPHSNSNNTNSNSNTAINSVSKNTNSFNTSNTTNTQSFPTATPTSTTLASLTEKLNENLYRRKKTDMIVKISPKINVKPDDMNENIENSPLQNKRLNSPLSFRSNIFDDVEKVVKHDRNSPLAHEKIYEENSEEESEKKSNNSKKSENNFKKRNSKLSLDEKMEKNLVPINKISIKENGINNNNDHIKQKTTSILSSTEEEREMHNFEIENTEGNDPEKNIFWNMKEMSNINDESTKRSNSVNKLENSYNPNSNKFNTATTNTKFNYKTTTSSQISCTISKIEKGVAILVSSDDYIFTLPVSFLPKNICPGTSYQMTIDETVKINKKINTIQMIQKKFLKSNAKK